jgi:hypothetical protein
MAAPDWCSSLLSITKQPSAETVEKFSLWLEKFSQPILPGRRREVAFYKQFIFGGRFLPLMNFFVRFRSIL